MHGVTFGGGFELALACDLIIADKMARFCFPELRLGLIPGFGGIPRLKRDLGNAVVRDLLLTGRSLNASARPQRRPGQPAGGGRRGAARWRARRRRRSANSIRQTSAAAKRFIKPIPQAELRAGDRHLLRCCAPGRPWKRPEQVRGKSPTRSPTCLETEDSPIERRSSNKPSTKSCNWPRRISRCRGRSCAPDDDFFKKLGIDSLQALELLTRLENHFHVELPDYEMQGVTDFRTLAERIQARL